MDKEKFIKGYALFVTGQWDLSPFEHLYELQCRDVIQEKMDSFSDAEKEEIKKLDKILIERAPQFYQALKGFIEGDRKNKPEAYWWWYLDKIANGELQPSI